MKKILLAACAMMLAVGVQAAEKASVEFKHNDAKKLIEVYVDGKHFTDFMYSTEFPKQILYPIQTASGKTITRGYSLEPRPYERYDHYHHQGMWFNFGDVNGFDFWNNSPERKLDLSAYGSIVFQQITKEEPEKGELTFLSFWIDGKGNKILEETTTYRFGGSADSRYIQRTTRLKAVADVTFKENKEGIIGIRMANAFEEPVKNAVERLDANGKKPGEKIVYTDGITGVYRNAEGLKTSKEVWGKRSAWVADRATMDGEVITVVIIDHKDNFGYPAWSHARDYGLFATNNIGGKAFDPNAPETKLVLKKGEKVTFKHRILIGGDLSDKQINKAAESFNK